MQISYDIISISTNMATGTWERGKYDDANYADVLATNNKIINLLLTNPGMCDSCRIPEPGFYGGPGVSMPDDRSMIDVETDLHKGYPIGPYDARRPYCPELYITSSDGVGTGEPCGGGIIPGMEKSQPRLKHLKECSFGQIESRSVMPPCSLRGTGYDRFDPLCSDVTDPKAWEFPGESNIQWRQVLKDTFKPCCLKPWSQDAALPPQNDEIPCQYINGKACANFIGDLEPNRFSQPWPIGYKTAA